MRDYISRAHPIIYCDFIFDSRININMAIVCSSGYRIASNYCSGIYFFPAVFHPGHYMRQVFISRRLWQMMTHRALDYAFNFIIVATLYLGH